MATTNNTDEQIMIAHGGGGELTQRLIAERFLPKLGNALLDPLTDSAIVDIPTGRVAFTTDSHVVQPLEFPGGDIGRLSVCGTVNDLAVMGAVPKALSLGVVIEEGMSLELLDRIIDSIAEAAREGDVAIATGDTKVIERQRGDGLILNTAGVGELRADARLDAKRIKPGDAVIVTGRIAEHGLAVMLARQNLAIETKLRSDLAVLNGLVGQMFDSGADLKFMRDPTRGGLAGVLADLAEATGLSIEIHEDAIPITGTARHAAELLGLDPLTVANEGKVVVVTPETDADRVVDACRAHSLGRQAAIIGTVRKSEPAIVELVTASGGRRLVQRPYGEELPRIC